MQIVSNRDNIKTCFLKKKKEKKWEKKSKSSVEKFTQSAKR